MDAGIALRLVCWSVTEEFQLLEYPWCPLHPDGYMGGSDDVSPITEVSPRCIHFRFASTDMCIPEYSSPGSKTVDPRV